MADDQRARSRRFRVGLGAIALCVGTLFLLAGGVVLAAVLVGKSAEQAAGIEAARRENAELKVSLVRTLRRIEGLEAATAKSGRLDDFLRFAFRSTQPVRAIPIGPVEAVDEPGPGVTALPTRPDDGLPRELPSLARRLDSPMAGWITLGFGPRAVPTPDQTEPHTGLDIANAPGTTVRAAAAGWVVFSGGTRQLGNLVVIDHGLGVKTCYAHLAEPHVASGARVQRGDAIGPLGEASQVAGAHLHFEVHLNGLPVDPQLLLAAIPCSDSIPVVSCGHE